MTESTSPTANAHRLALGLHSFLEFAGSYPVRVHLVYNWWDRIRSLFEEPSALIDVDASEENQEIKFHLGEPSSPPLTLEAFVGDLRELSEEQASGDIYASISFDLPEGDEQIHYVMNVPTRSLQVKLDRKRQQVVLTLVGVLKGGKRAGPA